MTIVGNRAQETTTTNGTGTVSLLGAVTVGVTKRLTCRAAAILADPSNSLGPWIVAYVMDDADDYEIGIGTLTAGSPDTLSRDTIIESSNGGAAVNWGPAGTRNVMLVPAAQVLNLLYGATDAATAGALAQRDDDGNLKVGTASDAAHAINKGDTEALVEVASDAAATAQAAADSAAGDAADVASDLATHAALTNPHGAAATATANRLALRDANGNASFAAPTSGGHAANKAYVDGLIAGLVFTSASQDNLAFPVGTTLLVRYSGSSIPARTALATIYISAARDYEYTMNAADSAGTLVGNWRSRGYGDDYLIFQRVS